MKGLRYRERIWIATTMLLLIFVVAIVIVGRKVNDIALQMNRTIITESCQNRFNQIAFELLRTEQVGLLAAAELRSKSTPQVAFDPLFLSSLLKLDPKIGRITIHQLAWSDSTTLSRDFWRLESFTTDIKGNRYRIDIEIPLQRLHDYIAEQSIMVKSYVTIVDRHGKILLHPDTALLGQMIDERQEERAIEAAIAANGQQQQRAMSGYLGVEVERLYFPITIAEQQLVVVVSTPLLSIGADMREFQSSTILIGLITIVMLCGLLVLLQMRWRREHNLRRKAEQGALLTQLQLIENKINPHFLFNSLNSLYALIGSDKELARRFVLSLSHVYRNLLEAHKEALSSLENEIGFTEEYFFLQKIRFAEQIELKVTIDKGCMGLKIPALSLQTLVENAIKHNCITPDNPLLISIYTIAGSLVIENNYTPRHISQGESFGLGLERIRTIYSLYSKEQMVTKIDGGTFRCQLPLIGEARESK